MQERLQKLLSEAGICSRRSAEVYLADGRISVNGQMAKVGDKADPETDEIRLDGAPLGAKAACCYLMLHKPRGYVTTLSDDRGRPAVPELIEDCGARVWPVGRLDFDSEGLLLMTNDGDLTNRLIHPSHEVEKEYLVTVSGVMATALPILEGPLELDGVPLHPAQIVRKGSNLISITIHEGKNRQVRRMCTLAGLVVLRLVRVREGGITLGDLPRGAWRRLTEDEVSALKAL